MVLAVQRVVKAQDRESIRDLPAMVDAVKQELAPVEEQWGVKIHEFGFSTFSPTPETLEITQLRKLAEEKLALFRQFRDAGGLGETAAVALISGASSRCGRSEAADRQAAAGRSRRRPAGRWATSTTTEADGSMIAWHARLAVGWAWWLIDLALWRAPGRWSPAVPVSTKHTRSTVVLAFVAFLRMCGTTVQTGYAGVLFSFGRAKKVLEPGFHPLIPIVQEVRQAADPVGDARPAAAAADDRRRAGVRRRRDAGDAHHRPGEGDDARWTTCGPGASPCCRWRSPR